MNGLELANRLRDGEKRRQLVVEVQQNREEKAQSRSSGTSVQEAAGGGGWLTSVRVSTVNREAPVYLSAGLSSSHPAELPPQPLGALHQPADAVGQTSGA